MLSGNGLKTLLLSGVIVFCFSHLRVQSSPFVIGYERFHSETPSIEGGRLLFNELGCVNCHDHPTGLPTRKGPRLDGLLQRARSDWVEAFLGDPDSMKRGATMPNMDLSDEEIEATKHYLASLKLKKKIPKAFKFVNADRGMRLYHTIGCVSCHTPDSDFDEDENRAQADGLSYPNVPFPDLQEKYDIHSLSAYLFKPHDFSSHGRMPKFTLEREDGGDLAAYLLEYTNGDSTNYPKIQSLEFDVAQANEGRKVLVSKNCIACHDFPQAERLRRKGLTKIRSTDFPSGDHPEYALSENQWQSITLFLNRRDKRAPVSTILESLNCVACHDRNSIGGPDTDRKKYFTGDHDLGDAGRFPPTLSDAGRKLQPKWLEGAIKGKRSIRPYLRVQMPDFGVSTKGLSKRFVNEDKVSVAKKSPNKNTEEGRTLLGTHGGLNCITCHGWDDRRSLGISSINLGNVHERLQVDWFREYLINPSVHRPNNLMPSFWPEGIASNQEILDGNTQAQINAIYSFSKYGVGLPEGFPDLKTNEFEIIPIDRPIVQRSFMKGVGTHALLIGYPEGIHFAFDAKSGNPAMMWKGRFFDAYTTWFSRFPEFEKPLGEEVVRWTGTDDSSGSQYRGYRFDSDGTPEFLVELKGAILYERLQPVTSESGELSVQRTVRYTNEIQWDDFRLKHPRRVNVTEVETGDPMTRKFVYQW
ncbi:MAG: c-type cytochrome [Opitutales bacterium]|jgi:mono/diheme cytochrome c family protein|nr:c-type cytochrome [Opitutales bacterium]MBT5815307.1 c-type cytochrome [Opitutales bacterium]MBT6378864.1 c-type cytochrome [Opitutales bacterium]